MSNTNTVMGWATLAGIVLVAAGLLGFLNTGLAGDSPSAILQVDAVHNIVHVVTGLLALYIAFGLRGENQVNAMLGFGILYVVIFLAVLLSPTLFGIFKVSANAPIHVIHAAVAVVSLAVGYMARGRSSAMAR
jgi:uncharacterized membrane protein HdeD (DUF308 family)